MAIIVDVSFDKLRATEVPEESRCEYAFNGRRCDQRRMKEDYRYCDVHDRWDQTALSELGAPLPRDQMSTQLFLAIALDQVMDKNLRRTDAEIQAIMCLAKLMAKNAVYI